MLTQFATFGSLVYVELSLSVISFGQGDIVAALASGYIQTTNGVSWQGNLPIEENSYAIAIVRSLQAGVMRLSAVTERV